MSVGGWGVNVRWWAEEKQEMLKRNGLVPKWPLPPG